MAKTREMQEQAVFFPISSEKLIELSLATFGLFGLYWTLRHWQQIEYRGTAVSSVIRAMCFPVTQYDLYRRIHGAADGEHRPRWHPLRLYSLYLIFTLLPIYMVLTEHYWGVLSYMLTLLPNLLVNQTVNKIHDDHLNSFSRNSDLDAIDWSILIAGLIGWLTLLAYGIQS